GIAAGRRSPGARACAAAAAGGSAARPRAACGDCEAPRGHHPRPARTAPWTLVNARYGGVVVDAGLEVSTWRVARLARGVGRNPDEEAWVGRVGSAASRSHEGRFRHAPLLFYARGSQVTSPAGRRSTTREGSLLALRRSKV